MADLIGKDLGRYHILERLGEGGMAVVYKAYDTRLESEVALKFIRTERLAPDILDKTLKRFEREAKALAKLSHPNIVKVTDYGEYEGRAYLVMPYLSGGTLKQSMKGSPIEWQKAVRTLLPIAEALDYAHRQGILHRDIKSSNILITESGAPMLADFGVAKLFEVEETVDLTGTGVGIGTPEYMAPEQGRGKSDPRSEIYSLGIVLYELITGRKPYTAETPLAVLIMQATDPLPPPRKLVASLPARVEGILFKALAKDPNARYQSMKEFADALSSISSDRSSYKLRPGRKNLVPLYASGILIAVLAGAFLTIRNINISIPTNAPSEMATTTPMPSAAVDHCVPTDPALLALAQERLNGMVPDAQVTWYDDFSCTSLASRWGIQKNGQRTRMGIMDGYVSIETDEQDGIWDRMYGNQRIGDGSGSLALFSYEQGAIGSLYIETGAWDTSSYLSRSLDIGVPFEGRWFTWVGRNNSLNDMGIVLRPQHWYYFLITVGNGQIKTTVWDKDNPTEMDESTIELGDSKTRWRFAAETHNEWIKLDEYFEFDLPNGN